MKFATFLLESSISNGQYKTPITEEKALELIKEHCSKVKNPFYRGMKKQASQFYIFQGDKGSRLSSTHKESGNYYNTLMDKFIQEKGANLPLRTKSIICANQANYNHIEHFGDQRFVVFPYDDTVIGYLPAFDIWYCKLKLGARLIGFLDFNELLSNVGSINSLDYDKLIDDIKRVISDDYVAPNGLALTSAKTLKSYFKDGDVEEILRKAFNEVSFFFGDASKDDNQEREVWIGGPCVAIELNTYYKLENEIKKWI